jgi:hypothetical protein
MSNNLEIIEAVVAGRYYAPELGGPLPSPIRRLALERSLAGQERALVESVDLGRKLAVVADETTFEVLGRRDWSPDAFALSERTAYRRWADSDFPFFRRILASILNTQGTVMSGMRFVLKTGRSEKA